MGRDGDSMNYRLTLAAAIAVILASISEFAIINGAAWLLTASGAVAVIALAGTLTRLTATSAAIGATLLAAAASVPLFQAPSPYVKAVGVLIVAICAASASRVRVLPALATLVTYLAALLLYCNAVLAGRQSFLRLIPTIASLRHLVHLANSTSALTKLPPPVPGSHGVQLLAAGSIGLAAIAVDILAVRLHRPAIAGLPLLVLFMAPITTAARTGGLGGAFAFLVAAAGYLGLLSADGRDRLRGWGRVITVWHYAGEDDRLGGAEVGALAATGRRIGLAAMCMALVIPLLLPSLHLHRIFGGGSGTGGGARTRDVELPDPVVQLRGLLAKSGSLPVLSYRTSAVNPVAPFQPSTQYLQVYVLNYDQGRGSWQLIPPDPSVPVAGVAPLLTAPGSTPAGPEFLTTTTITLGSVNGYASPVFFLPVPYPPSRLQIPGSWRESRATLMIFTGQGNRVGLHYTVTSEDADPTPAMLEVPQQIPAAIKTSYLGFNSAVTGKLRAIADQITAGAQNAYAKAVALEDWFISGHFTYSVQSNVPDTPAGLLRFLTKDRQGFCQQFAFAMAVLAPLVGIPSRIAIGFTAGHQRADGSWLVTGGDAHAWPELYFGGVGWLRFEPTPGGADGQGTAVQPAYVTATSAGGTTPGGSPGSSNPTTGPSPGASGAIKPPHVQGAQQGDNGAGTVVPVNHRASKLPLLLVALAILLLAAAAPGTARLAIRRRRWHAAATDTALANAAWQEVCDDLEDFGLPCRASESPRAVARRVSSGTDDQEARRAAGRIAAAVEQARYARAPATVGPIRADVAIVRRGLARSSSVTDRWRARLLPASTLTPVQSALRQALGLLTGWMPSAQDNPAA
jgi:transglutaminase-like putative cysteine protease